MRMTYSQITNRMFPSEGTPTTPLIHRAHHRHSSSAGPSTLDTTVQVQCRGRKGELMLSADGSVKFTPAEEVPITWRCLPHWRQSLPQMQYPGSDILGGTMMDERTVQIWYYIAKQGKLGPRRFLKKSAPVTCSSAAEAQRLLHALQSCGSWQGRSEPRKLVVIINPSSGRGRSTVVFRTKVLPVFEAGGLMCTIFETKYRGHATEIVKELHPSSCHAVIGVGGDGTIFEILQGFFHRKDWKDASAIPFAQIPTGSGNALAANSGMWTPEEAAVSICKGRTSPIDVVSFLQHPDRRIYSFLSSTYGAISNIDVGTDSLRWMGQGRFTIGALKEIFRRPGYSAIVAYMPADLKDADEGRTAAQDASSSDGPSISHLLPFLENSGVNLKDPSSLPEGWSTLPITCFGIFAACNLKWLDTNTPMAPEADLNTGSISIIFTGQMGLKAALDVFTKVDTDITKSSKVHAVKAVAFVLEPLAPEAETTLVVDGERVPFRTIFGQVHPGLCEVVVA